MAQMSERVVVGDATQYQVGGVFRSIRVGRVTAVIDGRTLEVDFGGADEGVTAGPPTKNTATPLQRTGATPVTKRARGNGKG